ncbi:sensor domain-containing diguanylate cyclase [Telmatospirillum siberiense]|nr:diguanylate cyclase [Telmatospirillum siberiense]
MEAFKISRKEKRRAWATAIALTVVSACGLVYGNVAAPLVPAFIGCFGSAILIMSCTTAYLLYGQSRLPGQSSIAGLSGAYLFSGITGFGFVLTLPGIFGGDPFPGSGPQTAAWLWMFWHGGFPCLVLLYLAIDSGRLRVPGYGGRILPLSLGGATLAIAIAFCAAPWLPDIVVGVSYNFDPGAAPWVFVLIVATGAMARVYWQTRGRTTIEMALVLAMFANVLDILVTMRGGQRFSVGWYLSKFNSILASGFVLAAYQHDLVLLSTRLFEANRRLESLVGIDGLTGIANRRRLDEHLERELRRISRSLRPLAVLLLDVDYFKKYNDTYGHQKGDEVLRQIAGILQRFANRPSDLAARFGGEEFCVILGDTGFDEAVLQASRVLDAIRAMAIPHDFATERGVVTVSIGVAACEDLSGKTTPAEVLEAADIALYAAKNQGRDRLETTRAALGMGPGYQGSSLIH